MRARRRVRDNHAWNTIGHYSSYHIDLSDIHGLKGIDKKIKNEFLGRWFADHKSCIRTTHGLRGFEPFLVDFDGLGRSYALGLDHRNRRRRSH
jgi:hypothetical protein